MAKIKVITDSTADLPGELANQCGITVLPMTTSFAGIDYRDGVDLTNAEFYTLLANSAELPHTSQHSPQFLADAYREALTDGASVIAIHLSSGLSGTMQNALLARELLNNPPGLYVMDSLNASLGQGLLACRAAELAQAGGSLEETVKKVVDLRKRMRANFVVNTLKYLLKGGRVNRLQATVGSVLDIKPILTINREGRLDQMDKIRGRKAALRRLLAIMEEQGSLAGQTVGISHALCLEDAQQIKQTLLKQHGVQKVIIGEIGAVIGTHVGPGTLAVFSQAE